MIVLLFLVEKCSEKAIFLERTFWLRQEMGSNG